MDIFNRNKSKELVTVNEGDSFQNSIEQLLLRKDIDFERMDKYLDIQERIMNKNAETEFNKALAEMQPKLPVIQRKTKGHSGKFASHEDIMIPYRPVLAEYGFSLSFGRKEVENGMIITGTLAHKGGYKTTEELSLPLDNSGNKNGIQAIGSTISYGIRYVIKMLLNVVSIGDDDDGHMGGTSFVDSIQIANIKALITEVGADNKKFLNFLKVSSIDNIPVKDYNRAINALEKKRE